MSMTVEEAIKELESYMPKDNGYNDKDIIAFKMAILALSEIQQYRAIGTVEELRELKEKATATVSYKVSKYDGIDY